MQKKWLAGIGAAGAALTAGAMLYYLREKATE